MNLRDLELTIVTEPGSQSPPAESRTRERLVTFESSAYLTSAHIDVTSLPATYALAKPFRFPSRRLLEAMDSDRWVRQRIRAANLIAVSELPPVHYSLNNLDRVRGTTASDRSTVAMIQSALLNASRHFHFARKTFH